MVDDQPNNRKLLVKQLSRIGLDVLDTASGEEAIALWQDWHPHLIWMDIRMPEVDGCEITRRIRQQEAEARQKAEGKGQEVEEKAEESEVVGWREGENFSPTTPPPHHPTKIIALTAQASIEERDRALAAGCDDFVSKPVQESVLFRKMTEHLGLRYLYHDAAGSRQKAEGSTGQVLRSTSQNPVSVQMMPPDWIAALRQAALNCNEEEVYPLIEQIPPEHTALIATLSQLTAVYQFDRILSLDPNGQCLWVRRRWGDGGMGRRGDGEK